MFERQYFLAKEQGKIGNFEGFRVVSVNDWFLSFQELNNYSFFENGSLKLHILGCVIHPDFPDVIPSEFAKEVLGDCRNLNDVNNALYKACGRFIVVISYMNEIYVRSDAVSLGQIYFDAVNEVICSDIKLYEYLVSGREDNILARRFYEMTMPRKGNGDAWIGDETIYTNLKKLLPNHLLNISTFSVSRYWPVKAKSKITLDECIDDLAIHLINTLQAFQNIAPLSIAVTAGNDSRLALAASLSLEKECYYFIDKIPKMKNGDVDIVIGKKLCDLAGVDYHIHEILPEDEVPKEFSEKYYGNTFFAKPERLAVAYKYYQDLSNYINICGVGEFGRSVFGNGVLPVSANFLCHKYHYTNSSFANQMATNWLNMYKKDLSHLGYNVYSLFYIEQKLGNWGAVGNCESDLAIEEVNPYASHYMIEKFISLPRKETTYINNKLFNELIYLFKPSLLSLPINPVYKAKNKIGKFLKSKFFFPYIDYSIFLYKRSKLRGVD